jgi:hypothetical protein
MIHRPRKDKGELSGDRATRQPSRYSRQSKKSGRRSSTASARSSFQPLTGEGKGRDSQSGLKILPVDRTRSVLMKRRGKTDPAYGTSPRERGLEMHLRLGAINLDKTSGPTSHEIVAWVKRILEVDKAGHSGTLDPKVTGILPVLLGDATRVMETLLMAGKEYICLMHVHKPVPKRRIIEVCGQFVGPILQKPPLKSSVVKELRTSAREESTGNDIPLNCQQAASKCSSPCVTCPESSGVTEKSSPQQACPSLTVEDRVSNLEKLLERVLTSSAETQSNISVISQTLVGLKEARKQKELVCSSKQADSAPQKPPTTSTARAENSSENTPGPSSEPASGGKLGTQKASKKRSKKSRKGTSSGTPVQGSPSA